MPDMLSELDQEEYLSWVDRAYAPPSPNHIKRAVLLRHNNINATWVETGTYYGETTEILATNAKEVISLEPEPKLYLKEQEKLKGLGNVTLVNEISETALPRILPKLSGEIRMWLDGHYSKGVTFAGPNDTPLRYELSAISEWAHNFKSLVVLIDDVRLCGRKHIYGEYPPLRDLVTFSESLNMGWKIEHDIFVAFSY